MLKNEGFLKILLILRCIRKSHIWHGDAMVKVAEEKDYEVVTVLRNLTSSC